MTFTRAIVRPPAATFARGLTTAGLGPPDLPLALAQHASYARALEACGLAVTTLPADDRFPDSTFVEDTAVLARGLAVLCRPGAPSRCPPERLSKSSGLPGDRRRICACPIDTHQEFGGSVS